MIVSIHNVYMYEMSVEFIFNGFTLQGLVQAACKGLQVALFRFQNFTIIVFHVVNGFGHDCMQIVEMFEQGELVESV